MFHTHMKKPSSSRSTGQQSSQRRSPVQAVRLQSTRQKTTKANTTTSLPTTTTTIALKKSTPKKATTTTKKITTTVAKKTAKVLKQVTDEDESLPEVSSTTIKLPSQSSQSQSSNRPPILHPTRQPQLPFSDTIVRQLVSNTPDRPGFNVEFMEKFFQCGIGDYAEGDLFLKNDLSSPAMHQLVKNSLIQWVETTGDPIQSIPMKDLEDLTSDPYNTIRQIGFECLTTIYNHKKTSKEQQKTIAKWYLKNGSCTKNWNVVDCSSYKIIGNWLVDNPSERKELMKLTKSGDFWEKRVAVVSSLALIKQGHFDEIIAMANYHLIPPSSSPGPRKLSTARTSIHNNPHNHLTQKAIGWMLREVGKKDRDVLDEFLLKDDNFLILPSFTYSYCLEKHSPSEREVYARKKNGDGFKRPGE